MALGAAPVLVIVRTSDVTDPTPYELRLRSELAAEGIDAIVTNPNTPGADVRQLAAKFGANAVVDVVVSTNELLTVIWAGDPSLSLEVTRQLRVSNLQRDAVGVFALRAVDFLRGARLELEQQRRTKVVAAANSAASSAGTANGQDSSAKPPPTTPLQPDADDDVRPAPAKSMRVSLGARGAPLRTDERSWGRNGIGSVDPFRIELSYALLVSSDKFGWSTAPALSFSWHSRSRWVLAATAAGPFVNHISTSSGQYRVTVDQELLQLELRRALPLGTAFELEPFVGLGGSRFAADGSASPAPRAGVVAIAWSLYTVIGASLVWHLGSHLHLVGNVAGFGRWQSPWVQRGERDLSGRSRWNMLVNLGPGWSF